MRALMRMIMGLGSIKMIYEYGEETRWSLLGESNGKRH